MGEGGRGKREIDRVMSDSFDGYEAWTFPFSSVSRGRLWSCLVLYMVAGVKEFGFV